MQMKVSKVFVKLQDAISSGQYRIILLPGGSRSSKTWSIMQAIIIYCCQHNNKRISVFREARTWLKPTVFNDFRSYMKMIGMWSEENVNMTDLIYTLNGNTIEFVGLDETQKLHGRKQDIAWFNEAMEVKWDDWKQISQRSPGLIIADWNPTDPNHFIYVNVMKRDDVHTIHSTVLDNPFIEDEIIKEIMSYEPTPANIAAGTASEYDWNVYGLGKFAKREGVIYSNWQEGEYNEKLPEVYFIDHGYNPDPMAIGSIAINENNKQVHVRELLYETELGDDDIVNAMNELVPREQITIADTSDPRINDLLRRNGWNILDADKRPGSIISGIKLFKGWTIIVSLHSPNLKIELNNYIWHNKRINMPRDEYNHLLDGMRYAFTHYKSAGNDFFFV